MENEESPSCEVNLGPELLPWPHARLEAAKGRTDSRHGGIRVLVRPHVSPVRVRNHTQTHIHIHTRASHAKVGPAEGGLKGRHAHGELEAHGGCGERYGSRVRENDGR